MERENNLAANAVKKLYRLALAIVIVIGFVCLFGCAVNNSTDTTGNPTGTTTAPSGEATPTEEALPSATPTPTLGPKTLQEVKDDLANVKVSVDDLMNEDVVYPTYFGAIDDNINTEIAKRTAYFESKGISFKRARLLVIALNYDLLTSDAVDREKADRCLETLYENNGRYGSIEMETILTLVTEHNAKNHDDQIVISWGIIENTENRAIINDTQQKVVKLLASNSTFEDVFLPTEKYDIMVTRKDGSSLQITGLYDDLDISIKYMNATIQASGVLHLFHTKHYGNGLTYETLARIEGNMDRLFESLEESRLLNTK